LESVPPVTLPPEVDKLHDRLADRRQRPRFPAAGRRLRRDVRRQHRAAPPRTIRTLLQMAIVLTYGASLPVVKVGRIAASTPSRAAPPLDALGLPSYRGDIVNALAPTPVARIPTRPG
jgi:3-deoxy-7-phosphoheptulonate synthase